MTRLIAVDWGTSSLRAYLLGERGRVLERRQLPWGLMHLPAEVQAGSEGGSEGSGKATAAAFEQAFLQACGSWLDAGPTLAVIASGMVGSAQGWREVPYLPVPVALEGLGRALVPLTTSGGKVVHLVPGLIEHSALPNVLRGEETQIVGAWEALAADGASDVLLGLPGTHSKWVRVRHGRIEHFETFMTGEVYAVLRAHTLLGRTMGKGKAFDSAAFERGVGVALGAASSAGVLSTIFSCRTLGLTGVLLPDAQADYLSGLLIGHELAGLAARMLPQDAGRPLRIALAGSPELCARYRRAMAIQGHAQVEVIEDAAARGLWQLGVQAGLVSGGAQRAPRLEEAGHA